MRTAKRTFLILLIAALGVAAGAAYYLIASPDHRAEAKIVPIATREVLGAGSGSSIEPFLQTVRSLVESRSVAVAAAASVGGVDAQTIDEDLTVESRPESSALDVQFHAGSEAQAVAVLGAAIGAFTRIVDQRLAADGEAPPLRVAVFDEPHAAGTTGLGLPESLAIGGLAGLLLGFALVYVLGGAPPRSAQPLAPAEHRAYDGLAPRGDGGGRGRALEDVR